ncbi:unnamed protein product, partial [Didymodactylos carnosus]
MTPKHLLIISKSTCLSSILCPMEKYQYSTELLANIADLYWTVDENNSEIIFELHVKTTGWIALGISPAGGMTGADIGIGWISNGTVYFQDRYAYGLSMPVIDNTTKDWFPLNGKEENGWTAIQFKRKLDTCDIMDVTIKSGTNILIFSYGLTDPGPNAQIEYHTPLRRGTKLIPLLSYANPPKESKFEGLDTFEFRLNNYIVPSNDTTYHCKIYKIPTYTQKRHVIATLIADENRDLVHHLLMYECDPEAEFDDQNLPDGV